VFTQLFFADGALLGSAPRQRELVGGEFQAPLSLQFYCETCGEVWAKAPVQHADGAQSPWLAYRSGCRKHPNHHSQPGGTLFMAWLPDVSTAFPEGVLRREFHLWDNFLKENENGNK